MTIDRWRHIARLRWRSIWSGRAVDAELDEELRLHLDQQAAANITSGMTPERARTEALRAIGGVEQRKEQMPDERGVSAIEKIVSDLRFAGVSADQKYADPRELNPKILFLPSAQITDPLSLRRRYVVRSKLAPADAIACLSAAVSAFDPTAAVRYSMLDTQVDETMLQERLLARLSFIFGLVALLLALVGLYGVVSYTVAGRRAEIGVRVALGASRSRILSMILGDVGRTLATGVAVGSVAALLSARRAAGIDPLTALRES